jgi:hypothetical protein
MLWCAVQREAGGRVCGITLKAVGNTSPPSAICALGESLIFIGSWLGHSNVVSYKFEDPEVFARAEKSQPCATDIVEQSLSTAALQATASITLQQVPIASGEPGPASIDLADDGDAAVLAASTGLDALVEQMKAEPSDTAAELPALVSAVDVDGEHQKAPLDTQAQAATHPDVASADVNTAERAKRSFGSIDAPLGQDDAAQDGSPAAKLPRIDEALTGIVMALEASSPEAMSHTPSSPTSALPFGPRGGTLVPGLGRVVVPGLGIIGGPSVTREESNTLTQGPEAPLEEENPSASSDDDNLEASLYQYAALNRLLAHLIKPVASPSSHSGAAR